MLRKIVFAVLLFAATFGARAAEYTDVYYSPTDGGGWGVFVVESDAPPTLFLAFFVFDQNGKPTWYSCLLTGDQAGMSFTGSLYLSGGTYYPLPWIPSAVQIMTVGSCAFTPSDVYNATLTYSLSGGPTVVKAIQRFPLKPYALPGTYSGSAAGAISGCQDPSFNDAAFRGRYVLTVATQNVDQSATLTLTFVDSVHSGLVCTLSGPLTHYGRLYQLNGQASCTGPGINTGLQSATVNSFHPSGQGIEGHWIGSLGGGCNGSLHFAAVKNTDN
jgi:hypothetical protein